MSRAAITAAIGSGQLGRARATAATAAASADMSPELSSASAPAARMTFADHLGQIRDVSRAATATATATDKASAQPLDESCDTIPDLRRLLAFGTIGTLAQLPAGATVTLGAARTVKSTATLGSADPKHTSTSTSTSPSTATLGSADPKHTSTPTIPPPSLLVLAPAPVANDASPGDDATASVAAAGTRPDAAPKLAAADPDDAGEATEPDAVHDASVEASAADSSPRTPLEQAVHDLIDQLRTSDRSSSDTGDDDDIHAARAHAHDDSAAGAPTVMITTAANAPNEPLPGTAARPAVALVPAMLHDDRAQLAASPNHLHLVVGEGDARVVLTVAVRGADINVSMRTGDDSTAAALARNAGSLDDAMRGRGLHLADFNAERDPHEPRPRRERPHAARAQPTAEPFTLEETP